MVAVGVEHAHPCVPRRASNAALVLHPLVGPNGGDAEPFAHAVGHDQALRTDELGPAVDEVGRHGRRALTHPLDAREVALLDAGQVGDALEHRRCAIERRDPVLLDRLNGAGRVEALQDDEAVAGDQVEEAVEAVQVVHGPEHQHRLRPRNRAAPLFGERRRQR